MTFTNKKRRKSSQKAELKKCCVATRYGENAVPFSYLLIALLCVPYKIAEGAFAEGPKNAIVLANHSTFFNCSKSDNKMTELTWYHHPLDGARQDVYDYKKIIDKYKGRFSIDKNITSGTFNLLVLRPEPTDAGRYECVEEDVEQNPGISAELIILDSNLVCASDKNLNEIIGTTECAKPITPDQLQLQCSVIFSGNFPPQIELRKAGCEVESNKTRCGVRGKRAMCNATLDANLCRDGSVYICRITTAEQYNCSFRVNKAIYAFANTKKREYLTEDEVTCVANASRQVPCSYKWFDNNTTEVSSHPTFKPNDPGLYRCQAQCVIRNNSCAFTAMVINVSTVPYPGSNLLWLMLLIPVVIGVLILAIRHRLISIKCFKGLVKQPVQPRLQPPEQPTDQEPADYEHERDALLQRPINDSGRAIETAFNQAHLIRRGLSGEIRVPGLLQIEDISLIRAYEKVECYNMDEREMSERVKTMYENGLKWKALNHVNLMKFYDVVLKSPAIYIAMEYAVKESLREELEKITNVLPIEMVINWAMQLANGINHLHQNSIVHKNIRSTQVFVVESSGEKTLKIACFNLFGDESSNDGSSVATKIAFSPPEELEQGEHSKVQADCSYDVWSFGIVLWEMLTKSEAYKGMSAVQTMNDIRKGAEELKIPESCPENVKQILEGCRIVETSKRLLIGEILRRLQELLDTGRR